MPLPDYGVVESSGWPLAAFGEVYHVGLRLPDIRRAMSELSDSMGLHWAAPQHIPMRPWIPGTGYQDLEITLAESVEGPVHVEVAEGTPGSIWDYRLGEGLHHFGVWVDSVGETVAGLVKQGWVLEMSAASPEEGYGGFAYIRSPAGIVFEPVSTGSQAIHQRWWGGGSLTG
jgi:catechol 2,3-dioxygenase-like lactoylglutathione lyase family enzyme